MRNAAKVCGEGGGAVRRLLQGCGGEVSGQGGRAATVGECSFNGFRYEVEGGAKKGSQSGTA
jgi:hypothetical protein